MRLTRLGKSFGDQKVDDRKIDLQPIHIEGKFALELTEVSREGPDSVRHIVFNDRESAERHILRCRDVFKNGE